ncbi:MAG TPA: ABC transporter substrate-binding protein [Chloroflexota bacterium]|nr:ABC transporter substrate-binding protein [Chloroflexota bacterium]
MTEGPATPAFSRRPGGRVPRRHLLTNAARLLGAGAAWSLAACAGGGARGNSAAPPATGQAAPSPAAPGRTTPASRVRVGVLGLTAEAGIYAAMAQGYFQQAGIDIDLVRFDSVTKAIPSLGTNQIEVGAGSIGASFFNAVERGVDVRIVGPQTEAKGDRGSLWFVVRKDLVDSGKFADYADFKGLTVALPSRGGSNEYQLDESLKRGGLGPGDVNVVELAFPDMVPALQNKQLDVAQISEPPATIAVDQGIGVKWRIASAWAPEFQLTYLLYSPQFRTAQADVGKRWMVAYLQGARWYERAVAGGPERDQLFQIIAEYTSVKDTALLSRMSFTTMPVNGEILTDDIVAQARWAQERGYTSAQPSLDQMIDPQFVEAAVAQLGKT